MNFVLRRRLNCCKRSQFYYYYIQQTFFFVLLFIYSVSLADLPGAICCTKIHGKKEEKCFIFLVKCCLVQRFFIMRYSKKYPVVMTTKKTEKGEMNMNSKIFTTYLYLSKILKPTFISF